MAVKKGKNQTKTPADGGKTQRKVTKISSESRVIRKLPLSKSAMNRRTLKRNDKVK